MTDIVGDIGFDMTVVGEERFLAAVRELTKTAETTNDLDIAVSLKDKLLGEQLKVKVEELAATVKNIQIGVHINDKLLATDFVSVSEQLALFTDDLEIDVQLKRTLLAKQLAVLKAEIGLFSRATKIRVDVDVDTPQLSLLGRVFTKIGSLATTAGNGLETVGISIAKLGLRAADAVTSMGPLLAALVILVPALVDIGATIGAITPTILALGGAFASVGAAAGVFFLALKGKSVQLTETKAVLKGLGDEFGRLRNRLSATVFDRVGAALKRLSGGPMRAVERGLQSVGREVNHTIRRFVGWLSVGRGADLLGRVIGNLAKIFRPLGRAVTSLTSGLFRLFNGATPMAIRFTKWVGTLADRFDKWVTRAEKDGSMEKWFKRVGDIAADVGSILGSIGSIFGTLFGAATDDKSVATLKEVKKSFEELSDEIKKARPDIDSFFASMNILIAVFAAAGTVLSVTWRALMIPIKVVGTIIGTTLAYLYVYGTRTINRIKTGFGDLGEKVSKVWENIKTRFHNMVERIKNGWNRMVDIIRTRIENFRNRVSRVWDNIKTRAVNAFNNIKNRVKGVVDSIADFFRGLPSRIMSSLGGVAGRIKDALTPNINLDFFATGGIVDTPTLGVFGEAGREALFPLNPSAPIKPGVEAAVAASLRARRGDTASGGGDVIINVDNPVDNPGVVGMMVLNRLAAASRI